MQKEPFIITLENDELPNLAAEAGEDMGFEFSKTKLWQEDNFEILKLLGTVIEKLDLIIRLMQKTGKD